MSQASGRLALLVSNMEGGGAQRSILKLANTLARSGREVDLVLPRATGPFLAEVDPAVRVVDLQAKRVLTSLPGLVRYLRRERPTAMISALNYVNIIAIWARTVARVGSVLVVTERNILTRSAERLPPNRRSLMPHLMRWFYPRADAVVAVAQGVKDDLVEFVGLSPTHVGVIYNPIVTEELLRRAAEPVSHPWLLEGATPVILGVGSLTPQKDFPTLIRAFKEVTRTRAARLLILGEGPDREGLERLVDQLDLAESVDLAGFEPNPYPSLSAAAAFVLSSRWEGLPGVLIEAMACGAPIVATDCHSGPREILNDGEYGALVPVGDVAAMASALESVLSGDAGRPPPESWERFDAHRVAGEYLNLVERL